MRKNNVIQIELPVGPSINRKYINRQYVVSREWKVYTAEVRLLCMTQGIKLIPKPKEVDVEIIWYRAKTHISHKSDIDSRVKVLLDALQTAVYDDDNQIRALSIVRDDTEPLNPRMDVCIWES